MKNRFNENMDTIHKFEVSNRWDLINKNTRILFRVPQQLVHIDNYVFDYVGATENFKEFASTESNGFYKNFIKLAVENRRETGEWAIPENFKIG